LQQDCCIYAAGSHIGDMEDKDQPKAAPVTETKPTPLPPEIGGTEGPEPTRYGDWSHKGRCTDF